MCEYDEEFYTQSVGKFVPDEDDKDKGEIFFNEDFIAKYPALEHLRVFRYKGWLFGCQMADVGFRILKQDDMSDKTVYSRRNPAIDMLRALTMFTMIFVNDFWKVHDVPHWLEHAVYGEDFMGLADIVFPCFLFAVGMSIPYAIERRYAKGFSAESTLGHILSRTFALLVMGAFITNSEFRP